MHLGMTGRFEIDGGAPARRPGDFALAAPADPKHAHVVFETDAGATRHLSSTRAASATWT